MIGTLSSPKDTTELWNNTSGQGADEGKQVKIGRHLREGLLKKNPLAGSLKVRLSLSSIPVLNERKVYQFSCCTSFSSK